MNPSIVITTGAVLLFSGIIGFAQTPSLVLPAGHTGTVQTISFSPDGKYLVTTSEDQTAKEWLVSTGDALYTFKTGEKYVQGVATIAEFSPDGKYIVTVFDSRILIWDAVTGKLLHTTDTLKDGHTDWIRALQFDPGKAAFFTAADDGRVKRWDLKTGKPTPRPEEQFGTVSALACSPDGKYLLTLAKEGIRVWITENWREVYGIFPESSNVDEISLSVQGDRVLVGRYTINTSMQLYSFPEGKLIRDLKNSTGSSHGFFSPDGKMVGATNISLKGRRIQWWRIDTGEVTDSLFVPYFSYCPIAYSRTGNTFAVGVGNTVKLGDSRVRRFNKTLSSYISWNSPLRMSRDGKYLLTRSGKSVVWQLSSSNILYNPDGTALKAQEISPDGKLLVIQLDSQTLQLRELRTGKILGELMKDKAKVRDIVFSPNDSCIVVSFDDRCAVVWDIPGIKQRFVIKAADRKPSQFLFTHNSHYLIEVDSNGPASLWSLPEGQFIRYIGSAREKIEHIDISADDLYAITSEGKRLKKWELSSGWCLMNVTDDTPNYLFGPELDSWLSDISFSPNGKTILCASMNHYALVRDAFSGKILDTLNHRHFVSVARYSPRGNYILTASGDNTVRLWETSSGRLQYILSGHNRAINSALFTPDGKAILTASNDGTSKKWDFRTGRLLETFIYFDSVGFLAQDSSGYYTCDPRSARTLYFVRDREKISFEQLDVQYNRPDRVMKTTATADTSLMFAYREAYYKRLETLGIDTGLFNTSYSIPSLDIVNRIQIDGKDTNRQEISFHIRAKDEQASLSRLKVWINEVPVFGSRGLDIAFRNSKNVDTILPVILSRGPNKIEASVVNRSGIESFRKPLTITYAAPKGKTVSETVYFLGIGSSRFKDSTHNLDWSAKDIRDLVAEFRKRYRDALVVDTLFDEKLTADNVRKMKKRLLTSRVDDKVVVAFSGHGLLSSHYDYYLSTYTVDFARPETNGLPYRQLEDLLDSIPARKKLMLLDACNSGEFDKADTLLYQQVQGYLDTLGGKRTATQMKKGSKGGHVTNLDTARVGTKNAFELMRELFVNVGKNTGSVIIAATSGKQLAYENGKLQNGVFIYSIREVLSSGRKLKVSELRRLSSERVFELTKGLQRPTTRDEPISQDWYIW
jgi:WD40 repeat protein